MKVNPIPWNALMKMLMLWYFSVILDFVMKQKKMLKRVFQNFISEVCIFLMIYIQFAHIHSMIFITWLMRWMSWHLTNGNTNCINVNDPHVILVSTHWWDTSWLWEWGGEQACDISKAPKIFELESLEHRFIIPWWWLQQL